MKKVLLVLIALVMIVVDCEDASAKNNLLEELINVVGKTSTSGDFESVREILISFGYQESADEVTFGDNANTYDAILSICEQEYGSYYGWTVSQRYQFDSLMVMLGQLPYCINLNPEQDNVDQSSALDIALSEIVQRYGDIPAWIAGTRHQRFRDHKHRKIPALRHRFYPDSWHNPSALSDIAQWFFPC